MRIFRTIKAKMLILIFICLTLGLALTNNLIHYEGSKLTLNEAQQRTDQISIKLTNHISGIFTDSYNDLQHIETLLGILNYSTLENQQKLNQYFSKILNKNKYYYGLWIYLYSQPEQSVMIQKNESQSVLKVIDPALLNQTDGIFAQAKSKSGIFLFNTYNRKDAQNLNLITLTTPLKDQNGTIIGVIGFDYKSSNFNSEINLHKPTEKGYVTLFTNDATYVTYPVDWKIGKKLNDAGKDRLPVDVLNAITMSIAQGKPHQYFDEKKIINFKFTPIDLDLHNEKLLNPWSLAVVIPLDETASKLELLSYYSFSINAVLIIILSGFILFVFMRLIDRPIRKVCRVAQEIAQGNLNSNVQAKRQDEMGQLLTAIGAMQSQLKQAQIEKEKFIKDILRLKVVLDHATANTMVADEEGFIVYMNHTAKQMFKNAEKDIRREMPHFNADEIVGHHFDKFHKNPAHQRKMVGELKQGVATGFKIGGRTMKFNGFPILNEQGQRIGTAVEWFDRTEQIKIEQHTQQIIKQVLSGNLKDRLPSKENYTDPLLGQLAESINQLLDVLHRELSHVSESVAHMTTSVSQTSRSAQDVTEHMQSTSKIAEQVDLKVKELNQNMHDIFESSEKINQIIDVMDNITLKTNMLALNASVEASRAGESGRSFMVVADEVRKLAQHAGDATNSIRELIKKSNSQIQNGNQLVESTSETVNQIVSSIHEIRDLMTEISQASVSQEKDIHEVNEAIQKINKE